MIEFNYEEIPNLKHRAIVKALCTTDLSILEIARRMLHILISWSRVSDHWSKGGKIIGAGPIQR